LAPRSLRCQGLLSRQADAVASLDNRQRRLRAGLRTSQVGTPVEQEETRPATRLTRFSRRRALSLAGIGLVGAAGGALLPHTVERLAASSQGALPATIAPIGSSILHNRGASGSVGGCVARLAAMLGEKGRAYAFAQSGG